MPRITTNDLSQDSPLHAHMAPGDFLDCYTVAKDIPAREAAEIITAFPPWARMLVVLRNLLLRPFGLLTEGPGEGEKLGLFPITAETPDEVIAGFDDRHLDFRVSVRSADGQVSLATWVHPHNMGGRIYLAVIMPFHILIARNALKRVAAT